jgi:hypothetical protein
MSPRETLFRLEIEFHRRLGTHAPGTGDQGYLHTSYTLQSGYDEIIRSLGPVTVRLPLTCSRCSHRHSQHRRLAHAVAWS